MATAHEAEPAPAPTKRADALRNEQKLLDAAAKVFVASGIDAPIRQIAAEASVGVGTIYRHFPTRADLTIAVFHHQIETLAQAGPDLLSDADSPYVALQRWIHLFVDFLVTKHGLAQALQSDSRGFESLHTYFLDRLLPVCGELLDAAVRDGDIMAGIGPYELMRAVGNLCVERDDDPRYQPRRVIDLLLRGLQPSPPSRPAST